MVLVESKEEGGQLRTQPLFDVHAIIKKLEHRLKIVSPEFFIQFLNEASLDRMENMLKNEATLFPSELANLNLMTLIPLESFRSFEAAVAEMLQTIERFRFEAFADKAELDTLIADVREYDKTIKDLDFDDDDAVDNWTDNHPLSKFDGYKISDLLDIVDDKDGTWANYLEIDTVKVNGVQDG